MVSQADIWTYLKNEAKFLGSTGLFTAAGGVVGAVVGWVITLFNGIPYLSTAIVEPTFAASVAGLAALGAGLGFVTSFIRRMLA